MSPRKLKEIHEAVEAAKPFNSSLMQQMQDARAKLDSMGWSTSGPTVNVDPAVFRGPTPEAMAAERQIQMVDALERQLDLMEAANKEQAERDRRGEEREQRMAELTAQSVKWARVAAIVGIVAVVVAILIST